MDDRMEEGVEAGIEDKMKRGWIIEDRKSGKK